MLCRVYLLSWRSRSSWGNCSGDNPHRIVSKRVFLAYIVSILIIWIEKGKAKGKAKIVRGTIQVISTPFSCCFIELLRRRRGHRRSHSLPPMTIFNFPLGVYTGSRLSRFNKLWGISLLGHRAKKEVKSKPGSLSTLMSLVFAVPLLRSLFY